MTTKAINHTTPIITDTGLGKQVREDLFRRTNPISQDPSLAPADRELAAYLKAQYDQTWSAD